MVSLAVSTESYAVLFSSGLKHFHSCPAFSGSEKRKKDSVEAAKSIGQSVAEVTSSCPGVQGCLSFSSSLALRPVLQPAASLEDATSTGGTLSSLVSPT